MADSSWAVLFGALIGFLAGLVAARYGARLAFENERRLESERRQNRERALLRALLWEMQGTLSLTYQVQTGRLSRIQRSAWDAARGVPMPDEVFAAVSEAYARADAHNTLIDTIYARASNPNYDTRPEQDAAQSLAVQEIRPLFHGAQFAVAKHLGMPAPWSDPPPLLTPSAHDG